jgi:hypothetical protein
LLATDSNIHNKHKILSEINKRWIIKPYCILYFKQWFWKFREMAGNKKNVYIKCKHR